MSKPFDATLKPPSVAGPQRGGQGLRDTRNKYMRCEKLFTGYDLVSGRFLSVRGTPGNWNLQDLAVPLARQVLEQGRPRSLHAQWWRKLTAYRQALVAIPHLRLQVLPLTEPFIGAAAMISQQYELLTGDALVVAVMQHHGLSHLASHDADFDHVPGLTRYARV